MTLHWICPPIEVRLEDDGVRVDLNTGNTLAVPVPGGPPGRQGNPGPVGPGVPPGGDAGQVLRKASSADYDGEWGDLPAETDPVFSASPAAGITSSDIAAWNGKSDFSGSYNDLTDKPTIPAKVSDLTNDSGFVTALDIYPVGSIYMSVNSTSPATLFGGTWQRIEDTFLLAAGTNHAAGSTGGEENHKLTVGEMPSHTHSAWFYQSSGSKSFGYNYGNAGNASQEQTSSSGIVNTGGGAAHNNMPPFLAVYVWQRTA